jgi:hypothetical protein
MAIRRPKATGWLETNRIFRWMLHWECVFSKAGGAKGQNSADAQNSQMKYIAVLLILSGHQFWHLLNVKSQISEIQHAL